MVTVCTQCRHFVNLEPGSVREHIWYNHLCEASPLPTRIDPYDGEEKPYGCNDLGTIYTSPYSFNFCRDINDGECPLFRRKGEGTHAL